MDAADLLSKGAQIAVAAAGLSAVVVVRRGSDVHAWPKADKLRLKLLLTTSLFPLALCLLGLMLLSAGLAPAAVWRWCSGVAAAVLLLGSLVFSWMFLRLPGRELRRVEASPRIYWSVSAAGLLMCGLEEYNSLMLGAFWLLYAFIVAALLVSLLQFLRFIFTRSVKRAEPRARSRLK